MNLKVLQGLSLQGCVSAGHQEASKDGKSEDCLGLILETERMGTLSLRRKSQLM